MTDVEMASGIMTIIKQHTSIAGSVKHKVVGLKNCTNSFQKSLEHHFPESEEWSIPIMREELTRILNEDLAIYPRDNRMRIVGVEDAVEAVLKWMQSQSNLIHDDD